MIWEQKTIQLEPKQRGFHLVTEEILSQLPELSRLARGQAHFFLLHTSASLGITENADSAVWRDLERHMNVLAPESADYLEHTVEGPDDMPAHIKSALLGCEITIPVNRGKLILGTWQGIYLGEHRYQGGARKITVTLWGEE